MPVMFFRTPFPVNFGADEVPLFHARAPYRMLSSMDRHMGSVGRLYHAEAIDLSDEYRNLRFNVVDVDDLSARERSRDWFLRAAESNHVLTYTLPRNKWTEQRSALRDSLERIWEERGWPGSYRDYSLQFSTAWEQLTGATRQASLTTVTGTGPWVTLRAGTYWPPVSLLGHVRSFVKVEV